MSLCHGCAVQQARAFATDSGVHHSDSQAIAAALHIPAHPQGAQYGTAASFACSLVMNVLWTGLAAGLPSLIRKSKQMARRQR